MSSAEASISEEFKSVLKLWWSIATLPWSQLRTCQESIYLGKQLSSLTEIYTVVFILLFGFLLSVLVANSLIF